MRQKLPDLPFTMPEPIGPFDPQDFVAAENARGVGKRLRDIAEATFYALGRIDMSFFLFCGRAPGLPENTLVAVSMRDDAVYSQPNKALFSRFLTAFCGGTSAVAVGWFSETWLNFAADQESVERWRDAHNGSLQGHPDTQEKLMFTLECDRFIDIWTASISEAPDAMCPGKTRRKLGAWEQLRDFRVEGRFVHLLKPVEKKAN